MKLTILLILIPIFAIAHTLTSSKSSEQKVVYEDVEVKRAITIGPTSIEITNWNGTETLQVAIVAENVQPYSGQLCHFYEAIGPNDIKHMIVPCPDCKTPEVSVTEYRFLTALSTVILIDK